MNLLDEYFPEDPTEQEDKARMLDFISREPNCFERSCQEGHFTASCWLKNFDGSAARQDHLPDNRDVQRMFRKWKKLKNEESGFLKS
jgi:hypothetical protein